MSKMLEVGSLVSPINTQNIHGNPLTIPNANGLWTHLQFRRFSGCPVCNLHLQTFIQRYAELRAVGINEVVVFHSSDAELLPYQGQFPFDVIGDSEKTLYRQFGVETSIWAILNPKGWPAAIRGNLAKDKPAVVKSRWGFLGLPADVLLSPEGIVKAVHYGTYAYDQWSFDELLSKFASVSR